MQSVIQRKSYGSVRVFWLNKEFLFDRLKEAADRLIQDRADTEKVVVFGSLAQNRATAFSDADIMIIVEDSAKRFIDRPDEFRNYFQDIGIESDLFVYTKAEVKQIPFVRRALSQGIGIAAKR